MLRNWAYRKRRPAPCTRVDLGALFAEIGQFIAPLTQRDARAYLAQRGTPAALDLLHALLAQDARAQR